MLADDLVIVPAQPEHSWELAPFLREEDRRELWLAAHKSPLRALLDSLALSHEAWTARWNGQVGAMWGVVPVPEIGSRVGCVWLLTGELLEHHRLSFARAARLELVRLLERWERLFNLVAHECSQSLRWLRWAGFEVGAEVPWGPEGAPFHWVELARKKEAPYV